MTNKKRPRNTARTQKKRYCTIRILLLTVFCANSMVNAQTDAAYSFIVAGHAYGAHSGGNTGLHPALLNRLDSGFDTNTTFFVFTGDIVNQSTLESWQQVEDEMAEYSLPYYYAMGNHDDNDIGRQVFEDKFGGTYYTFHSQRELFIVLNSVESGRSISTDQIDFLSEQLDMAGDTILNIFIFFHEILWNSHEKYKDVRSNSRSRYYQIKDYSNYWTEVHPLLLAKPQKNFFIITGDVGGNPDAIAAFYDKWDNITLISSGMGEVPDENYLLVKVHTADSIEFKLVPLNDTLNLENIKNYSVPSSVENIFGPSNIEQGSINIEYSVPEVFNADSYIWELPEGVSGASTTNSILLNFNPDFTHGSLSVKAFKDGFGNGPETTMVINANFSSIVLNKNIDTFSQINFTETIDRISIGIKDYKENELTIRIFDGKGRILKSEKIWGHSGFTEAHINKHDFSKGLYLIQISTQTASKTKKIIIR